jgi:hypothetical protein
MSRTFFSKVEIPENSRAVTLYHNPALSYRERAVGNSAIIGPGWSSIRTLCGTEGWDAITADQPIHVDLHTHHPEWREESHVHLSPKNTIVTVEKLRCVFTQFENAYQSSWRESPQQLPEESMQEALEVLANRSKMTYHKKPIHIDYIPASWSSLTTSFFNGFVTGLVFSETEKHLRFAGLSPIQARLLINAVVLLSHMLLGEFSLALITLTCALSIASKNREICGLLQSTLMAYTFISAANTSTKNALDFGATVIGGIAGSAVPRAIDAIQKNLLSRTRFIADEELEDVFPPDTQFHIEL